MEVTTIFPVYNGGIKILDTLEKVMEFSKKHKNHNFLFVNDGSTDNTKKIILNKIKESKNKKINLLSYSNNKGKGYAIKKGVEKAQGDFICFLDSDLAYSLDYLLGFEKSLEKSEVVIGCRGNEKIRPIRIIAGEIFNFFSRCVLNLNFKDMQAGIKGFRKNIAKELFEKQTIKGFAFDVEIVYLSKKKKYSITEFPVHISNPDSYNESKVNLIRDSLKMFRDLIKIKLNDFLRKYD